MELSAVVPLPVSVGDNNAAAFHPLAGEPPLTRIVRLMVGAVSDPRRVVVAAADTLVGDIRERLAFHGLSAVSIAPVPSAGTRGECISAALEHLDREAQASSHVLLHEISRPLASAELRDRVIAGLRGGGEVVVPALAVTDSVKAVDARGFVTATVDRSSLRTVQYPRGFATDRLSKLLARRASEEFDELDEAIRAGIAVTVVDGDPEAFRVELPRDAQFVEAIIGSRRPDPHGA